MSCSNSKNYARIKEVSIDTGLSRSQVSALFHQIKPAHKRGDATAREQAFATARANLFDAARASLATASASASANASKTQAQAQVEDRRGTAAIPAELLQKFSTVSIPGLNEAEVRELAAAYLSNSISESEGQPPSLSTWLWKMALERNKDSQRFLDVHQRSQYPTEHYLRRYPFQTWEEAETFSLSGGKKGLIPGRFNVVGEHIIAIQPSSSVASVSDAAPSTTTGAAEAEAEANGKGEVVSAGAAGVGDSNTQPPQVLVLQTMSGHDKTGRLEETFFDFKTYKGRHDLKQVASLYGDVLKLLLDNPGKVIVENRHDENFRWFSLVDAQTGELSIYHDGSQGESELKLSAEEHHYIQERLGLFPSAIAPADWQRWTKKRGLRLTEPAATDLPWNCSECGEPRGSNPAGCYLCEENSIEAKFATAIDTETGTGTGTTVSAPAAVAGAEETLKPASASLLFDAYGRRREQPYKDVRVGTTSANPSPSRGSTRLVTPFQHPAGYNSLDYNQLVASSTRFITVRRMEQGYFGRVAGEINREVKHLQRTQPNYLITDTEMLRLLKDNAIELDLRVYDQYRPLQMLPLTSIEQGVSDSPYALPITDEDIISLATDYGCRRTRTTLTTASITQPESGRKPAGSGTDASAGASTSKPKPKELELNSAQIEMGIGIGRAIPVQVNWHPLHGVNIKPLPIPTSSTAKAKAVLTQHTNTNTNTNINAQVQFQEPVPGTGVWLDWDTWDYLVEGSHECRAWKKALVAGANEYQAVDRIETEIEIETETETLSPPTPSLDRRTDAREADDDLPF
jgi:hypothetical protein